MKVLVINCGSSSLKYQLIDSRSEEVLAAGLCERIGIDGRMTGSLSFGLLMTCLGLCVVLTVVIVSIF